MRSPPSGTNKVSIELAPREEHEKMKFICFTSPLMKYEGEACFHMFHTAPGVVNTRIKRVQVKRNEFQMKSN